MCVLCVDVYQPRQDVDYYSAPPRISALLQGRFEGRGEQGFYQSDRSEVLTWP
jgi:hypothetical protein